MENELDTTVYNTVNNTDLIGFHGNPNLKSLKEKIEYTPEQIQVYKRCAKDPFYFINNFIKVVTVDKGLQQIQLRDYQSDMIKNFINNRLNIVTASRQSGKCLRSNCTINVKNKDINNGKPFSIEIGVFYEWLRYRKFIQECFGDV